MGILKVILYFYYVLVIMCWFFVGIFELNNDFDIFYSDRVFFWGGGYFQFEMGCGVIWVIFCNFLQFFLVFDVIEIVSEVIMNEKVMLVYMVFLMLEIILKRKMFLRINKIIIGSFFVFLFFLECIGEICDEFQVVYGMIEIVVIVFMMFNVENKIGLNGLLSFRFLFGVKMKVMDDERFL